MKFLIINIDILLVYLTIEITVLMLHTTEEIELSSPKFVGMFSQPSSSPHQPEEQDPHFCRTSLCHIGFPQQEPKRK
jgi:hypothetical protein